LLNLKKNIFMEHDLSSIRKEYLNAKLDESILDKNPMIQFQKWLAEAINSSETEPTAMVLSTVSADGKPSSRIVLLKETGRKNLMFFTNYTSRKGKELAVNPHASLLFFWPDLQRQVRIEGKVEKTSAIDSDQYFASRPEASQLASWASTQSEIISGRQELEEAFQQEFLRFSKAPISRPPHWGGFQLIPENFEFWQGRESRLHDRLKYIKSGDEWKIIRLAP
jgi:pyridoxamine 5'-phosphate oxidase